MKKLFKFVLIIAVICVIGFVALSFINVDKKDTLTGINDDSIDLTQEVGSIDEKTKVYRVSENVFIKNYDVEDDLNDDFMMYIYDYQFEELIVDFALYKENLEQGQSSSVAFERAIEHSFEKEESDSIKELIDKTFSPEMLDYAMTNFKENIDKIPYLFEKMVSAIGQIGNEFWELLQGAFEEIIQNN